MHVIFSLEKEKNTSLSDVYEDIPLDEMHNYYCTDSKKYKDRLLY